MNSQTAVVLMKEGQWYVARSLELGVVSQGRTVDEAAANLKEAVELYLEDQPKEKKLLSKKHPASFVTSIEI